MYADHFQTVIDTSTEGSRAEMNFKNVKVRNLLICITIGIIYPIIAYTSSENNKMLALINSLFITGIVYIAIGVLYSFILHGDMDITEYFVLSKARTRSDGSKIPFEEFKKSKEENREGKFNYPLLVGILLVITAAILSLCY